MARRSTAFKLAAVLGLSLGGTLLALVAAEIGLRVSGQEPGVVQPTRFGVSTQISLLDGIIADEDGVLKFDPAVRGKIAEAIEAERPLAGRNFERSLVELVDSFRAADVSNPFTSMIAKIEAKEAGARTDLENAYLAYSRSPLNSEGFRSIEFERYEGAPSVLLVGDSFTWGYSADPLTHSFADHLAAAGYAVFNTGITAVGPAQYEVLGRKWLAELRPDFVIVNFYMANDIVWFEQKLLPHQFTQYPTNVGFFEAAPRGEYFDNFRDAYEFTLQFYRIPDVDTSVLNRWCARTALGTKLWAWMARTGRVSRYAARFADYAKRNEGYQSRHPLSETHLERIKETSESVGTRFILAVIPDLPGSVSHGHEPEDIFDTLDYHIPHLELADYHPRPDAHFNNEGHRKYAAFLDGLMKEASAGRGAAKPQ